MLTEFGQWVRTFRIKRGMLLKDMADDLGYPSSYVSGLENGRTPVPESYCDELRDMYDLPLGQYFELRNLANCPMKSVSISLQGMPLENQRKLIRLLEIIPELFQSGKLDEIIAPYLKEESSPTLDDVIKAMHKKSRKEN